MNYALAFGRVLRRLRKERGLSQEKLAELANIQRNYVSLMERAVHQPTLEKLFQLADALNIDLSFLIAQVKEEIDVKYKK